jgi:hypothetical protein
MSREGVTNRPYTYRIQGLPPKCTREKVQQFIEAALNPDGRGCFSIRVHSIAQSAIVKNEMTATISSSDLHFVLADATRSPCWKFEIPMQPAGQFDDESAVITVDTLFDGFTALNSFDDAKEHLYEYDRHCSLRLLLWQDTNGFVFLSCIAIPGLGGHAFASFEERNGTHMWLRDSLPADLKGVRVLVYGYDAKLAESKSFQYLEALASTFRRLLLLVRRQSTVVLSTFLTPPAIDFELIGVC